ncbi:MAG: diaminopropionate ammonia-lyase [Pseudomonadota bacterium]|jgi:diaminopropionate ammonia-lyase|nr:diaminopropionate ammonia-lyase [Pseudomonadota bacterium]
MSNINRKSTCRIALNPQCSTHLDYPAEASAVLNNGGLERAKRSISAWPGYARTPLRNLTDLASHLNIRSLWYKDEQPRFGLGSFKPLGGAYAVARLLQKQIGKQLSSREPTIDELLKGIHKIATDKLTVTAATDGNHGRSVAWGAQLFGCQCVIFVHETVTDARQQAITDFGARVIRTAGTFDDAVRQASASASDRGWHLIPDTSDGTVVEAPRDVMQGYTVMADEAIVQLGEEKPPTHLFLQAGVGGMAAAVCAQFWQTFADNTPRVILVEPHTAGCWFESLSMGKPTPINGSLESIMAGLACGEVSYLAWKILHTGAYAMMTISDDAAANSMCLLANTKQVAPPVVAGESGAAGLAGLIAARYDADHSTLLGLDCNSRVLVFGTEGATDPQSYQCIVGRTAAAVLQQGPGS